MNLNDQPKLGEMLEEVCAIYSKPYSDVLTHAYYRVLRVHSFEAISKAMLRILTDESRRQLMPTAAEIKAIARHMETNSGEQTYLRCQHLGCKTLIGWPPIGEISEASYFCPQHKPAHQREWDEEKQMSARATVEERQEILAQLTPAGRAFIRPALAGLMAGIPITDEERAAGEQQAILKRPVAFAETAQGPGVNPSVFLHNHFLTEGLTSEYAERRQMVAAAGWKFRPSEGYWTKGKRQLTDQQVDSFSDRGILADFLGRR